MGLGSILGSGGPTIPTDSILAQITTPFSNKVKNSERGADFPTGFEITEFVEGQPQTPIQLTGNLMPFQPFKWGGEQKLVKEYYPGNPEAAVQILGPREGPVTIVGRFKDKHYDGKSIPYGTSYQYTLLMDQLRKRGNLLKFGMNGPNGSWIRYGFLENSNFEMKKLSWIDYSLELFVVSENRPVNNYFAADSVTAPSTVNSSIIAAASAFNSKYSQIPSSMPASLADKMNQLISAVATSINLVTNFVGTVLSTAADVEQSANRALGLIKNARVTVSNLRLQADNITHSFTNFSNSTTASGKVTDMFNNLAYIHENVKASSSLSQYLAQMQAQFEQISQTLPKARYKVVAGDTLQNISVKFYNVVDNWTLIYDHNNLKSTILVPGTILEIPKT